MICPNCGFENDANSNFCKSCGINLFPNQQVPRNQRVSDKNWLVTLLLCIFLGPLGIHRFYVGKTGTGILMLLTFGGLGIWVLIDLILIVTDAFTDINGLRLNKQLDTY
jgi:TM2 domain-containing membrane protein YozV